MTLREKILCEEGVEAFARILGAGLPQALVATRDFKAEVAKQLALKMERALEESAEMTPHKSQEGRQRPNLSVAYTAPRDSVEKSIAELWQALLGIETVGIDDNFFELGGHSLLAVQILASLRRTLEVELSLRDLFAGPTIRKWAAIVAEKRAASSPKTAAGIDAWEVDGAPFMKELLARARGGDPYGHLQNQNDACVVAIQPQGKRPPFFCVHALSGSASVFYDLSKWMGAEQPFYAFQSRGLDALAGPCSSIEEMATRYIQAMRGIQPRGPYLLGGWSFGCLVAFEMARQLVADSDRVDTLAFIDMGVPVDQTIGEQDTAALLVEMVKSFANDTLILPENLRPLSPDEQLISVWSLLKERRLIPYGFDLKWFRAYFDVFQANCKAAVNYALRAYTGSATLFRAAENPIGDRQDETRGWKEYVTGPVEVITTPGDHYTITREPHVRALAEHLNNCIDESRKRNRNEHE